MKIPNNVCILIGFCVVVIAVCGYLRATREMATTERLLNAGFQECLVDGFTTEKGWQKGESNVVRRPDQEKK